MRLTKELREQIVCSVLQHRFSAEVVSLVAARAALADELYLDVYRKADRERMEALPKDWLPESGVVCAAFGDAGRGYGQVELNGGIGYGFLRTLIAKPAKEVEQRRRILAKHRHGPWKVYDLSHKLAKLYHELRERQTDLEKRATVAGDQLRSTLNSVTTVPALVKAWPEMEPFVRGMSVTTPKLPAIPVATLNAMFKLPVSEQRTGA